MTSVNSQIIKYFLAVATQKSAIVVTNVTKGSHMSFRKQSFQ